ncbi:MAG: hypothetical protein OXC95_06505 [Dehalococcoidia bacterium]|nr:hypothetical protein [Dehalococcoidia bacterium]
MWELGWIAEDVSQEEWDAEYKGRIVTVDAYWEESWSGIASGKRVAAYSGSAGGSTIVWAHLKGYEEEVTWAGVWECKLAEMEGMKYKTVRLRGCTLIRSLDGE